jgi:hypothetical protein
MIVITANQLHAAEQDTPELSAVAGLNSIFGDRLPLSHSGELGEEFQMLVDTGELAMAVALVLTRGGQWSVGIGVGTAVEPLDESVQSGSGNAFVAAHGAVLRARKKSTHLAVAAQPRHQLARDAEALADLLLILRARRSSQGWEIHDLLATGLTQAEAAGRMGITPQSASKRARAAEIKAEDAAVGPLARLLDRLDESVTVPAARPAVRPSAQAESPTSVETRSGGLGG